MIDTSCYISGPVGDPDPFEDVSVEIFLPARRSVSRRRVYLSYEDQSNNYVQFDDFKVTYTPGNVIQYNEYYPYGLQTANSWTRENNKNNNLYNDGSELNSTSGWYETFFRGYDASLGRFMQVDPLAHVDHSISPFVYAGSNPTLFNDPSGLLINGENAYERVVRHRDEAFMAGYWGADGGGSNWATDFGAEGGGGGGGGGRSGDGKGEYGPGDASVHKEGAVVDNQFGRWVLQDGNWIDVSTPRQIELRNEWKRTQGEGVLNSLFGAEGDVSVSLSLEGAATVSEAARKEMIIARTGQSALNNVGRSGNLKTIYWLGQGSKWLGRAGNVAALASVIGDTNSLAEGTISVPQYSYNTLGTATSIAVGTMYGGPYGLLVSLTFIAGQEVYDGVTWFGEELSKGVVQTNNALSNGWRFGY